MTEAPDGATPGATTPPSDAPPPDDARTRAFAEEQAHVDRVHRRVEELRTAALARQRRIEADHSDSTFQGRFQRDVAAHHQATRAARYTFGDLESLVFGRLDQADGEVLHVGRVAVADEERDVLLVDWRAPAAAAFYQATPATPLGVARRRTLVTHGPELSDLDDELLDTDAADALGLDPVTGQGALLSALERTRTAHMRDIVATIQAEQDRIIRLPASGTVIVTGGPGTGKTVVALHRVAYLLYTHRDRFEGRGVLVVGPSTAFTEYISRVLPSLGEDQAVLRPLGGFAPPEVDTEGWDDVDVAALKGDLRMIELARRLVATALPPLPPEIRVSFDGTTARVSGRELEQARERLLRRLDADRVGASYHERRLDAERAMLAALWRGWSSSRRDAGLKVPDDPRSAGFHVEVGEGPQTVMLRRSFWPVLRAHDVLARVVDGRTPLDDVADGLFDRDERAVLARTWGPGERWTVDDVAVLDELRALLGPVPTRAPRGREDGGIRLSIEEDEIEVEGPDVDDLDYADFAHVVVDEAQDLTPMQWRMLSRRGPYASWTVVGDLAQRSRVAEPRTWDEIAALVGRRNVTVTTLHVNYRTPHEVVDVARAILSLAGHDPDAAPRSVRHSGLPPRLVRSDRLVPAAWEEVNARVGEHAGTIGVIAPDARVPALAAALPPAIRDRVRVLDPRTAKGLEFDDVVVVAPDEIASSSDVGLHQLYVAVTRATRSLTLVARPGVEVPGEQVLAASDAPEDAEARRDEDDAVA